MNRKRNISYIKPEDPNFIKVLKAQAGYDNTNHKFDKLENAEEDFVSDDETELPQIVVLKNGDLTAEEVEREKLNLEEEESKKKADLSQRVIFKAKGKLEKKSEKNNKKKDNKDKCYNSKSKINANRKQLLSFADNDDDNDN